MFYSMMHSTYFIYSYMASDKWTIGHLLPPPHGLLFPISSKVSFICIILQTGWYILQHLYTRANNVSTMRDRRKEGRKLRLYDVGHVVKNHSDSKRGNLALPHGLLFPISSKGSFIYTIPQTGWHTPKAGFRP